MEGKYMRQKFALLEYVGLVMWSKARAMAGDSEPGSGQIYLSPQISHFQNFVHRDQT